MPTVSVIVPAHNSAAHVGECIASLLDQTHHAFELILINDGSTDETGLILDRYAAADQRIRVHHQPNAGLAETRNRGIAMATGEYIVFVDSDDVVSSDHLEHLVAAVAANDVDIAVCRTLQFFGDGDSRNTIYQLPTGIHPAADVLCASLYYDIYPSAWGKIVRRDLFGPEPFTAGVLYEDMVPSSRLFASVERVASVPGTYRYMMRPESIQHRDFVAAQADKVWQARLVYDGTKLQPEQVRRAARHLLVSCCFNTLSKMPRGREFSVERRQIRAIVRRHRSKVLRDPRARRKARGACALSYLGFGVLDHLYRYFKSV